MKRISFLLTIAFLFLANSALAGTWCAKAVDDQPILSTCKTATVTTDGREILDLKSVGLGLVGGSDADKNAMGYYKMVAGESTPLQAFQIYAGWLYSFTANEFIKTRQIIMNYDNMTLAEFKWQKYWEFYNTYVEPPRSADCVYSGYIIPKTARVLMGDAIDAGKAMTYEVYNEATGMPAYFSRTAVQAQGILDACLAAIDTANATMKIKGEAIMACVDGDCVNAITWE